MNFGVLFRDDLGLLVTKPSTEHGAESSSSTVLCHQMDLIPASVAGRDLVEYIIGVVIPVYTIQLEP